MWGAQVYAFLILATPTQKYTKLMLKTEFVIYIHVAVFDHTEELGNQRCNRFRHVVPNRPIKVNCSGTEYIVNNS